MHFEDLTLCRYHSGPFDASNWQVPLLTVGWLESPHKFATGTVPDAFLSKLRTFTSLAKSSYPPFRGRHACSICESKATEAKQGLVGSEVVIFVPGNHAVYAASGGIIHYIDSHAYQPPLDFVNAAMRCPSYGSTEFQDALKAANNDILPPLILESRGVHG